MQQPLTLPLGVAGVSYTIAGHKGARLSQLTQAGFGIPAGFIVTTHACRTYLAAHALGDFIGARLNAVHPGDLAGLTAASEAIRTHFIAGVMPASLTDAVHLAYAALGQPPVAVRSSGTAEDQDQTSFAGQLETYLNVPDEAALLRAIVNCWSSQWTVHAIRYRAYHALARADLAMGVVVQAMAHGEASGVLFTANPLHGRRTEIAIEAVFGPGEGLHAGRVVPDRYLVETTSGRIVHKAIPGRAMSIPAQRCGRHPGQGVPTQVLPDEAIIALSQLARRVVAQVGSPQDIEWTLVDGQIMLLQSRRVTSLFPLPEGLPPQPLRVFVMHGLLQGSLEPITPLGQAVLARLISGAARLIGLQRAPEVQGVRTVAAERLLIDITGFLHDYGTRAFLRRMLPAMQPLLAQAMDPLWEDPRLQPQGWRTGARTLASVAMALVPILGRTLFPLLQPARARDRIQRHVEAFLAAVRARSDATSTLAERLTLLEEMLDTANREILSPILPGLAAGVISLLVLRRLAAPLPEEAPRVWELLRGVPDNVTTEMNLLLWATARSIRSDPPSAARFAAADAATLATEARAGQLPAAAQEAIARFLTRFGMRGMSEIDLGRDRWHEDPLPIIQTLQNYLAIADAEQAPDVVFARGAAAATIAVNRLASSLQQTRGGWLKARMARWAARRVRALAGLRESPKFFRVCVLDLLRQTLLESGRQLVLQGVLARSDDLFFLNLAELRSLALGNFGDWQTRVTRRRQTYEREQRRRQLPCLLLSDGEVIFNTMPGDASGDAPLLVGTPVSPGIAEGVLRVMLDPDERTLKPSEIIVCSATDPGWTPLFLIARGLIAEGGGLMTHGSVVAREYGIPAVVGVPHATQRLQTGQRVRIDGSSGQILILPSSRDQACSPD